MRLGHPKISLRVSYWHVGMHATWIPAGIPTHHCLLLPACTSVSPPILPGAQRCWPRALAEFRGIGVDVNVTASLRVLQTRCTVRLVAPLLADDTRGPYRRLAQKHGIQFYDFFFSPTRLDFPLQRTPVNWGILQHQVGSLKHTNILN